MYGGYRDARLKLIETLIAKRKYYYEGKLCCSFLTHKELVRSGADPEDLEGAIDFIRNVKGVKAAFLATEWKSGKVKISFRSSSGFNVNRIAKTLKGGGHTRAAGATLNQDMASAVKKVIRCFSALSK